MKKKIIQLFILIFAINLNSYAQFNGVFELSDINGINGFVMNGESNNNRTGRAISSAGDLNSDGFDDIIISAYQANPNGVTEAGIVYVVFGSNQTNLSSVDLSGLNGVNGFKVIGRNGGDNLGVSIASAGDINGDGINDIILGASGRNPNGKTNAGACYVIYGSNSGFSSSIDLGTLNGTNGFVIKGQNIGDALGSSVSFVGDVNSDGVDDIILGAHAADPMGVNQAGASFVIYGNPQGFAPSLDLNNSAEFNDSIGFKIVGVSAFDHSGSMLSSAGDMNADGIDDILLGVQDADPDGRTDAGISYVIFGGQGFQSPFELSTLNGSNGFILKGNNSQEQSGHSVDSIGDFNGDEISDIVIGAHMASPNGTQSGISYIVFGSSDGFNSTVDLALLNGTNGFVAKGANSFDVTGFSVSSAGDVNGDSFVDLIISSHGSDPNGVTNAGLTYILFGMGDSFQSQIDLDSITSSQGFRINGVSSQDTTSINVNQGGDINGDGIDDILIGAARIDPNGITDAGGGYVVYGKLDLIFKDGFD